MKKDVQNKLFQLLKWCHQQNDLGYDPYDLLSFNEFVLSLQGDKHSLSRTKLYIRFIINQLNFYAPLLTRKLIGINKLTHPTYMGCMMHTYLNLYSIDENESHLKKSNQYRKWLLENTATHAENISWGTPFKWKSGSVVYELGTPFNVVTAWNASAFMKRYELLKDPEDLKILHSIYAFFTTELIQSKSEDGSICFSYSSVKGDFIHNANLFAAEFLISYGKLTENNEAIDLGRSACKYTLAQQLESGLITYYGKESDFYSEFNDSYHSSYEIRMLNSIFALTGWDFVKKAAEKYKGYYLENYYVNGEIKLKKNKSGPTDISSQADGILLFSAEKESVDRNPHLTETIKYTLTNFQSNKGFFFYKKLKSGHMIKAPYIRWAQGWMALALSDVLKKSND